jgi:large subunit ribosomal protein L3
VSDQAARKGIIGRKVGMTQLFDQESGRVTPVTVIEAGPCPVVAVRTADGDGYAGVQLAYGPCKEKKLTRPRAGHLKAAGVAPHRTLIEFRGAGEGLAAGDTVTVEAFEVGERVKVSGTSKGKGFAGTIKRHNFGRGPASHGSHNIRQPGSIGASAYPARVFKGMRMAGQMGNERVTQRGLRVAEVDPERNLLLVTGAVPGPVGGVVEIRSEG